jgi:hypothetical protein
MILGPSSLATHLLEVDCRANSILGTPLSGWELANNPDSISRARSGYAKINDVA